jgi:HSP20 family protein
MMERWRPRGLTLPRTFREMEEEMDRFWNETMRIWPMRLSWRRVPGENEAWAPSMDMYEKEDSFILRFELPGVKPEDVDISMSGDTLTIKGERRVPMGIKEEEYQCTEMCYGAFSRSITIPTAVKTEKIEANFENGILEIALPKAEEVKPKQIKIQTKQLKAGKS